MLDLIGGAIVIGVGVVFLVCMIIADTMLARDAVSAVRKEIRKGKRASSIAAQEARISKLRTYCVELSDDKVSETRQGIRNGYLKVALERLAQEETKLEAMRIEEDEKKFEEIV